ncbi:tyrosine-type recombinase/integrase [Methylibium rhizosphaerae]|uniref:tyrosine-type recombinase/integrase n=1 Tax=Methylibium rhizosphaerae TaxID=2570323 RepID=UPI0011294C22|nr:tyrosine-type recombinase/integrase [Methylibium rhizosphaerae]
MGRKPTRWTNLPRGMRARPRGRLVHYYLDSGGKPRKEIPLGSDYARAVQKWAELTCVKPPAVAAGTFAEVLEHYWKNVIPTKAPRTQKDNEAEKVWLLRFFNDPPAPLDAIEPVHIRKYLDWRAREARKAAEARNAERRKDGRPAIPIPAKYGQVRANREKALFSHVWNYAREHGFTKAPNPCQGIKGFREEGRDAYVDDELLERVMEHAGRPLQLALRLAHLTGQRPGDVLRMSETDVADGILRVKQGKTKAKLRIVIEGELKVLLAELAAYKAARTPESKVRALQLLVNEKGERLTAAMLRKRFDSARDAAGIDKTAFQFRDLRAKAATETDDVSGTRGAQALLGHTTESMTAEYIRHKAGRKVKPLR